MKAVVLLCFTLAAYGIVAGVVVGFGIVGVKELVHAL